MISEYRKFQAKLYPVLPFLMIQAFKVRKMRHLHPSISESVILGNGERKVLILGESTAAGVGASTQEFTLVGHLFQQLGQNFTLFNFGKNGLRASQALSHFEENLNSIPGKFEGVLLFLGANDCFRLTHPGNYRSELEGLIQYLKGNFSPDWIYLADIPPVQVFPAFPKLLQHYLNQQRTFLQKEMISISDKRKGVLFDPIKIEINPLFFASDLIHPSDAGYQKIAEFAVAGLVKNGLLKLH